jgi:tRNA threonylcarbamoyl adenosine modification protein YeaZ
VTAAVLLLALDTSSAAVTAALHDGVHLLAEHTVLDARHHAELLAPTIAQVLTDAGVGRADLDAVVVGVGPGPFTGLRVGLVTARVLGAALSVPVHGICSLDALAESASGTGVGPEFLVATDARRREVYWAGYRVVGARAERVRGPQVARPDDVPRGGLPVVGRGARLYPDVLGPALDPLEPSAAALATIAVRELAAPTGALLDPEPLYLRRPDAAPPGERKRVLR